MRATFAEARPRMKELAPGVIRCPRCLMPAEGWPLQRPDNCGPGPGPRCIRRPETVLATRTDKDLLRLMKALGAIWPQRHAIPTYPANMQPWARKEADGYLDGMSDGFYESFGLTGGA